MVAYRTPGIEGEPPPMEPAAPALFVCRRCGVVAPARGTACAVCAEPLGQTRVRAPALAGGAFWVAVRCAFTCNSCRFLAPLDALDAGGAVECASCGLRQRFDVESWRVALGFAHAVGDLAGPEPEGRHPHPTLWIGSENPYARVGDTHAFEHRDGIRGQGVTVDAAPGHPVCRACRLPLATSATGPGAVETQCAHCGDRARYAVSDEARDLSPSLLGAVADEHRTDRPRANATPTQAGVVALSCPACGAPLTLDGGGRLHTCAFCKASCIVPANRGPRRRQDTPLPEVWWLLFRGPSSERRALEAPTGEASAAVTRALQLIKPAASTAPIGDAPGVYEAPEAVGVNWPQVALTLLLGSVAVAVGFGLYEALAP